VAERLPSTKIGKGKLRIADSKEKADRWRRNTERAKTASLPERAGNIIGDWPGTLSKGGNESHFRRS